MSVAAGGCVSMFCLFSMQMMATNLVTSRCHNYNEEAKVPLANLLFAQMGLKMNAIKTQAMHDYGTWEDQFGHLLSGILLSAERPVLEQPGKNWTPNASPAQDATRTCDAASTSLVARHLAHVHQVYNTPRDTSHDDYLHRAAHTIPA